MIRAVYAYDLTEARGFAAEHAPELDMDLVAKYGSSLEIRADGELIGLMLYAWADRDTMQVHIIVRPDWRCRWMTKTIVIDIHAWPRLMGADRLITRAATPTVGDMLRRMGWAEDDGVWCRQF